jgi:uncharacterized membrane protein YhaH (DUF805 family)
MRAPMFGAFALTLLAAMACLFVGVIVTAGISGSMSAREAGDLLMWMGGGQLVAVAAFVAAYGWLARRWSGATPPWWSHLLLGVLLLGVAAMLFVLAMVLMNR